MLRSRTAVLSVLPAVLASVLVACDVPGAGTDSGRPPSSASSAEPPERQLDALKVAPRGSMDGYDRDRYPHWSSRGDNCDTREAVLKRDGENVRTGSDCAVESGTWESPYDGEKWTDPADVDIDHMVPLANSWVSGADKWTDERREELANDLERPQLLAVTDNVNQSKSDRAPDEWRPPLKSYWCRYATDWTAVKHAYRLTVTEKEKAALKSMLGTC